MRLFGLTTLAAAFGSGAAFASEDIEGEWLMDGGKAHVVIAPCGASMCRTVVKAIPGPDGDIVRDPRNPDPKLRSLPVVGVSVLVGLKSKGGAWTDRKIYDLEDGSAIELQADGALKMPGCVAVLCQSELWKRLI